MSKSTQTVTVSWLHEPNVLKQHLVFELDPFKVCKRFTVSRLRKPNVLKSTQTVTVSRLHKPNVLKKTGLFIFELDPSKVRKRFNVSKLRKPSVPKSTHTVHGFKAAQAKRVQKYANGSPVQGCVPKSTHMVHRREHIKATHHESRLERATLNPPFTRLSTPKPPNPNPSPQPLPPNPSPPTPPPQPLPPNPSPPTPPPHRPATPPGQPAPFRASASSVAVRCSRSSCCCCSASEALSASRAQRGLRRKAQRKGAEGWKPGRRTGKGRRSLTQHTARMVEIEIKKKKTRHLRIHG